MPQGCPVWAAVCRDDDLAKMQQQMPEGFENVDMGNLTSARVDAQFVPHRSADFRTPVDRYCERSAHRSRPRSAGGHAQDKSKG